MMCPDCKGWGYLDAGGPCPTCNGEGELPDTNFPTKQTEQPPQEPDAIDKLVDELSLLIDENETSYEEDEPEPPTFPEQDADWWKQDEENDYGD